MAVFVDADKCSGCALCVSVCPVQAVSIKDNKAVIDQNICNECLQCLDECPNDAIYQVLEKDISVAERQDSEPYSPHPVSSRSDQIIRANEGKPKLGDRDGGWLDIIKKLAYSFFQGDSSYSRGKKGGRGRYGGHRGGHRGGMGRRR